MFKRIAAAYSESPEAKRALTSAVHLARTLGAELRAVIILQAPSAYTAYADAVDPSVTNIINSDRMQAYERLHSQAYEAALREGVEFEKIFWKARRWTPSSTSSLITKQISSWSDFIITNRTCHVFAARFMHLHRMLLVASFGSTKTMPEQSEVSARVLQ
jgi:nucleotide-binding universal stress UspA family protein